MKKITSDRCCWRCGRQDISLDKDVINCHQLREACEEFRERGRLGDDHLEGLEVLREANNYSEHGDKKLLDKLQGQPLICSFYWLTAYKKKISHQKTPN